MSFRTNKSLLLNLTWKETMEFKDQIFIITSHPCAKSIHVVRVMRIFSFENAQHLGSICFFPKWSFCISFLKMYCYYYITVINTGIIILEPVQTVYQELVYSPSYDNCFARIYFSIK